MILEIKLDEENVSGYYHLTTYKYQQQTNLVEINRVEKGIIYWHVKIQFEIIEFKRI